MKKLSFFGILLIMGILVVSGCSKKSVDEPKDDPVISTETETEGGSLEHGDGYGFDEFELEINFDNDEEIEIDYEVIDKAGEEVKASYQNTLANLDIKDEKAMNEIGELFIYLLLTKDMPEEEVIDKILTFYELEDYTKFELEVNFDEGTELRIKDVK